MKTLVTPYYPNTTHFDLMINTTHLNLMINIPSSSNTPTRVSYIWSP